MSSPQTPNTKYIRRIFAAVTTTVLLLATLASLALLGLLALLATLSDRVPLTQQRKAASASLTNIQEIEEASTTTLQNSLHPKAKLE